ncbi:MAG: BrnT family toxin [Proteobacteria bacterium]|nr:BrnT family toxin [Pseudomonadota bacterium]
MCFEWNQDKDRVNQVKHMVSFETACLVFDDPHHLSIQDRYEHNEERWNTLGMVDGVVLLLVAHTVVDDDVEEVIRIISARKATRKERPIYEQAYNKTKD